MAAQMLALIDAADDNVVLSFTDGSHDCDNDRTGGGVSIFRGGVPISRHSFALADSTNNEAELFALGASLDRLHAMVEDGLLPREEEFHLFTDSEYSYDLLMGNSIPHINIHLIHHTIRKFRTFLALAPNTTLHWLPGHLHIKGNDDADKLAKLGASQSLGNNPDSISVIDRVYSLYDSQDSLFTHFVAHSIVSVPD
jgi:ribonuclease HI